MKFIEEMRHRPENERLAFAIIVAGVVALLLFLLWGATFFNRSENIVQIEAPSQGASAAGSLRDVGTSVTGAVNEFSVQYNQLRQALNEAGLGEKPSGVNTVELTLDDNGDVQVENIIVEQETLSEDAEAEK
ncbi:MAG: hypothetical protein JKX80_02755 [Candidatus Pacebacteria bacterium]|nr:hypothetical protein [Candidatus Paceibacterota bacterium]